MFAHLPEDLRAATEAVAARAGQAVTAWWC